MAGSKAEKIWKTSVKELLTIFRGALTSIIPWVEKAKIQWKDEAAYDDWDNIAEALFENIVCSSLNGAVLASYPIAKYGLQYDDYADIEYILVKNPKHLNEKLVFVGFTTKETPFDSILVAQIDEQNKVIECKDLEWDSSDFVFVSHNNDEKECIEIYL